VIAAGTLVGIDSDPKPLVWLGLVVIITGAALLGVGLNRYAQHADRAAGVKGAYGQTSTKVD